MLNLVQYSNYQSLKNNFYEKHPLIYEVFVYPKIY